MFVYQQKRNKLELKEDKGTDCYWLEKKRVYTSKLIHYILLYSIS